MNPATSLAKLGQDLRVSLRSLSVSISLLLSVFPPLLLCVYMFVRLSGRTSFICDKLTVRSVSSDRLMVML